MPRGRGWTCFKPFIISFFTGLQAAKRPRTKCQGEGQRCMRNMSRRSSLRRRNTFSFNAFNVQGTWITLCVCKSVYCHAIDSNEAEGWMNGFMDLFHEIGWRWRGGGGNLLLFTLHITFYATPPEAGCCGSCQSYRPRQPRSDFLPSSSAD